MAADRAHIPQSILANTLLLVGKTGSSACTLTLMWSFAASIADAAQTPLEQFHCHFTSKLSFVLASVSAPTVKNTFNFTLVWSFAACDFGCCANTLRLLVGKTRAVTKECRLTKLCVVVSGGAFIDQSQSLNVFMQSPNFGKLTSMHFYAWCDTYSPLRF